MPDYRYNSTKQRIAVFNTREDAEFKVPPKSFVFSSEEELGAIDKTELTSGDLVKLYNDYSPKQVNKFQDRATGVRRLWELLQKVDAEQIKEVAAQSPLTAQVTEEEALTETMKVAEETLEQIVPATGEANGGVPEPEPTTEQPEPEPKPVTTAVPALRRGRKPGAKTDQYIGKLIRPLVKENPRRVGSHGFRSMKIILDKPDGISVEAFLASGGRMKDLSWDLKFKHVVIK